MDYPNLRRKTNCLRPITRKAVHDGMESDHSYKSVNRNYKYTSAYQITFIPSGTVYIQNMTKPSIKNFSPIKQDKIEDLFESKIERNKEKMLQSLKNAQLMEELEIKTPTKTKTVVPLNNQGEQANQIKEIVTSLKLNETSNQASIEKMEKLLGYHESQIIDKTLKKLLSKQLLYDEAKIHICSHCLIAGLTVVKYYAKKIIKELGENPFEVINNINKGILQYLMSKYPRSKNLFVEMELLSKFDNISFLTLHENNMLVNCRFTFTEKSPTRVQILDRTKLFLNRIMNELDSKFMIFTKKMNEKLFKLKTSEIDLKLNKVKIGRKIPENTEKFYQFNTQQMQIHSPKMFRVMIKWIQSLERLLTSPSDIINKRSSIKYIKKNLGIGNIVFDEIQSKRFQEMKIDIIEKISSQTEWKQQINKLLQKLNEFNNNLVNTLTVRSPKNKFISQEQAETLKFAKFNTLFLEWLIVEKFLILIQALCKLSNYFETKYFKKLDFIEFNVFDLMRASFSGKKQQILQIFSNMHELEEEGEITILRTKNRLNTPLNDVLINFMIKQSFIICEVQLILVQTLQEGEEKLKMMESLNHIIYELQRTPYGSLSEMGLIVGYYDPTIIYESKIIFQKDWFKDEVCPNSEGKHQFIQVQDQTTPFVCSWCVNFYGRQQNFFEYNQCINCSLQKCKACVFQDDLIEQKRVYYKYFASCFFKMSLQQIENDKDDDFIDNLFIRDQTYFIHEKYLKIRDELHIDGKNTKLEALEGILHSKQKQYGLKATEPFYCLLLKFEHGQHCLKVIKYANYKVEICTQEKEIDKKFRVEKHDALFFFRKRIYRNPKENNYTHINSSPSAEVKVLKDITDGTKVRLRKKGFNVIYICNNKENYLLDWQVIFNREADGDTQKITRVLSNIIKKCDDYKAQRNCLQLQNLGLRYNHLQPILKKKWKNSVKVLNLSNNYISCFKEALSDFENVQELYLSHNIIVDIKVEQKKNKIKVLDLSYNQILILPSQINHLTELINFKIGNNKIQQISDLSLPNLEELRINDNNIGDFIALAKSILPELQILNISNNKLKQVKEKFDLAVLAKFINLRKIQAMGINFQLDQQTALNLNYFKKLQNLELSKNKIYKISSLYGKHLRDIRMINCQLLSLDNVLTDKLIHLETIGLQRNRIKQFPKLDLPQVYEISLNANGMQSINHLSKSYLPCLKSLNLQNNMIVSIDALERQDFPDLKNIYLQHNKIETLPLLCFPSLQILNITNNELKDIDNLSKSKLENLKRLMVQDNKISKLPMLNFPNLQQFTPCQNKVKELADFQNSYIPKIIKLNLWMNKIIELPEINLPESEQLLLFNNKIKDITNLLTSQLDHIKIISLYNNKITKIPIIKFHTLEKFYGYKNSINDINSIRFWETPSLQVLHFNENQISYVPKFAQYSLHEIQLSQNRITDLTDFSQSHLPHLRKLFLNKNEKMKKLCGMPKFGKLQQIQACKCGLTDIDEFAQYQLKNLKKIFVENNEIEKLPKMNNFKNLTEIYIRWNKLKTIKHHFSYTKKLRRFWATSNQMQSIQTQIYEDSVIEELSFSRNPIKTIEIPQNLKLKSLTLCNCHIKDLSGFYAPRLSQLNLKDNQLKNIQFLTEPGGFLGLSVLVLQKNEIKEIPALDLPNLRELSLKKNPLEMIDQLLLSILPKIKKIYLGNSLTNSTPTIKKIESVENDNMGVIQIEQEGSEQEEDMNISTQMKILVKSEITSLTRQNFIKQFNKLFPNCHIKL